MNYLFAISHMIIIATALWAIFSPRIDDGFFGKLALAFMCFSSVSAIGWALEFPGSVDQSDAVFSTAVAVMAIRCYWLKIWARRLRRKVKELRK